MPVYGNNERQPHGCFGRSHGDGEDHEYHTCERFGSGAEPPKSDEIEVGRVQHQLDPNQDDDRAASNECSRQSHAEQKCGNQQVAGQWCHPPSFSLSAMITAPMVAAVNSSAIISSGKTYRLINSIPILCTA